MVSRIAPRELKSWNSRVSDSSFTVAKRLKACRKALSAWKRKNNMNAQDKIRKCEVELEKIQSEIWPSLQKVPVDGRPSFAWRSILHGRSLLEKGIEKKIGNGASVKVWIDPWLDDNALEEHFRPEDILRIRKIRPVVSRDDFYIWKFNKSGDFTVKSAYWLSAKDLDSEVMTVATALPSTNDLKSQIWKIPTDPKIRVFLWKVVSGCLPVAKAFLGRGMRMDPTCQMCGLDDESCTHVLFSCSFARQVWAISDFPFPPDGSEMMSWNGQRLKLWRLMMLVV
ncbi:unnamed protein product [Arabidopsis thaliana]|uniref:(thale cress) hypothetical protein n=1 Tax=Arabidopsis thaliana TaxID=3702 RepID=A0A7G2DWN1_ARATH|nr:unnamed protein product [Arabidopsis thaliana]